MAQISAYNGNFTGKIVVNGRYVLNALDLKLFSSLSL